MTRLMTPTWRNWSRLATATPTRVATPGTVAEVTAEVRAAQAAGSTVKMVGSGHSFTSIGVPGDTMLRPEGLTGIIAVDRSAMTVTAAAGMRLKHFNAALELLGLSLHNMGDVAEQTLAGAISTGTHGTGGHAASLAAQVVGLEIVTGTGEVLQATADQHPEVLDLARVGLGALGVVTAVTFEVEPLFLLEAVETLMPWDEVLGSLDDLVAGNHHVDLYWFPHTDRVAVKRNNRLADDVTAAVPVPRWKAALDGFLSNEVADLEMNLVNRVVPRAVPRVNAFNARMFPADRYVDVAHRVFTSRRSLRFREMEYGVPREAGVAALTEVRRAIDRSRLRVGFPVEVRIVPADDVPLSPATGRDTVYVALHMHHSTDHTTYFALTEPILRDHGGRPHWGKLHSLAADDLTELYPRFDEFRGLRDRLDPHRVFANDHLRRLLGP